MRGFGIGLRAVRSARRITQREIARAVLGDVDDRKIADFANYMSRVERETRDARNPSLLLLEQYAQWMDLTLSAMFAEIEGIAARLQDTQLRNPVLKSVTPRPMMSPIGGRDEQSSPVSAASYREDMARLRASVTSIESELARERQRVKRLADRLERSTAPRRKKSARG